MSDEFREEKRKPESGDEAGKSEAMKDEDSSEQEQSPGEAQTSGAGDGDNGTGGDDSVGSPEEFPGEDDKDEFQEEMPLTAHLEELRRRLVRSFIAAFVGFAACYGFSKQLFEILMEPMVRVLHNSNFIYTYPPEAFFTYIKVSFVAGIFLVSPYIFYQIWQFVAPGLYRHERRYLVPVAFFSALFFVAGALFGYFVVFPFGFDFFASFSTENIVFTPKLSEYLGFSLKLLFAFGVIFELPLFIFFLARLGLVTSQGLKKKRKYAILLSFVVSAILTPPDIITQSLMAGPLIILYQVGIWVALLFGKEKKPKANEESESSET